ncbi:MAG TPA: hypothetical protein VFK05_23560 [Polyangiaceae bacterium]|nr:hypothetical protein [Polyangiaceae bacterium]
MTLVVELRDFKKDPRRPVSCCWQRSLELLCAQRFRVACMVLLGVALGYPVDSGWVARDGVLASLCDVLTAAVSATLALACDACDGLGALLSDPPSPMLGLSARLNGCFGEPLLAFDTCPAGRPFPTFSGLRLCALGVCALLLFGCGMARREPVGPDARSRKLRVGPTSGV